MYFYYILLTLTFIHLTCSADDMNKDMNRISCYKCVSTTKKPMPECEMKAFMKHKDLKKVQIVNCTRNNRGQMPKCFTATGSNKENANITVRDCGTILDGISMSKCGITLDNKFKIKGFNACIKTCEEDNCNAAHNPQANIHFLIKVLIVSMIVFCLSDKVSLLISE